MARETKTKQWGKLRVVRSFDSPAEYADEAATGRSYSIPHSDGSFFSDGSGYSNGREWDRRFEIIERLEEVLLRLETLDLSAFLHSDDRRRNSDFLPYAHEIEQDIRDSRKALLEFSSDGNVIDLASWLEAFREKAQRYLTAAARLAGIFADNVAVSGGKGFGSVVGAAGGMAFLLWCTGSDFDGIAQAIVDYVAVRGLR